MLGDVVETIYSVEEDDEGEETVKVRDQDDTDTYTDPVWQKWRLIPGIDDTEEVGDALRARYIFDLPCRKCWADLLTLVIGDSVVLISPQPAT